MLSSLETKEVPSVPSRGARRVALRWGATAGTIILLIAVGAWVRLLPHMSYYPIPGVYRAYSVYDILHILRTGHEIRQGEAGPVTSYSTGVYLGTQDILRHKVDASVILLLGLDRGDLQAYYRYGLWSPLVVVPLAIFALYSALARARGRPTGYRGLLLVAFAVLGSFSMISVTFHGETNTATGWSFMLMALYGLVRIREAPVGGRVLFFVFCALLVMLYHTSAILLVSCVVVLAIWTLVRGGRHAPYTHSLTTLLVIAVLVLAYFMYVSVSYFDFLSRTLTKAPSLIIYLLRQQGGTSPGSVLADLLAPGPPAFPYEMLALALLVAVPVAGVFLVAVRGRLTRLCGLQATNVLFPWLLGLIPFSLGLFIWNGISGLEWKLGEFGSLFSLIALSCLLAAPLARRLTAALTILVIVCMVLSTVMYYTYNRNGPSYLTYAEEEAGTWLAERAGPREVVFTDLRLAMPLIVHDHLMVVGINDYERPRTVRRWLEAIYYGSDARAAQAALDEIWVPAGTQMRYALFSQRAERDLPGIKGYDYNFRGAPAGYTRKFLSLPGWSLVYDNGTVQIFELPNQRSDHAR